MELFTPYGSLDKKKRVSLFLLLALCLLALAFIFYNSSLPPAESGEQSDAVGGVIESVLPEGAPITDFLVTNVRTTAHFLEFFLLGTLTSLLFVLFSYRPLLLSIPSVVLGILVGLLDETVQIFSGRGPEILDVWVDTFGYFTATALVVLIYFAYKAILAKRKKEE